MKKTVHILEHVFTILTEFAETHLSAKKFTSLGPITEYELYRLETVVNAEASDNLVICH